jgi:hypothetical protein
MKTVLILTFIGFCICFTCEHNFQCLKQEYCSFQNKCEKKTFEVCLFDDDCESNEICHLKTSLKKK